MKEALKVVGFGLVIIGTGGLLVTEFSLEAGCTASLLTKVFAAFNGVGLASLAFAHWGLRPKRAAR